MFGNDIMTTNAVTMQSTTDAKEWTYNHIIELLEMRIQAYKNLIDKFDDNHFSSELPFYLINSYPEFFEKIGTPDSLKGYSPLYEKKAELISQDDIPFFPGFILGIGDSSDYILYLVEISNPTKQIINLFTNGYFLYTEKSPLKLPVKFTVISTNIIENKNNIPDIQKLKKQKGTLLWDGENITLVENHFFLKKTIFKTKE